ncbi:hypothetical protein DO70_3259 [Burkholderia pseudomallei]|nr:hypothetical protein DO70_3259 [Burkholderia pseudomallei]
MKARGGAETAMSRRQQGGTLRRRRCGQHGPCERRGLGRVAAEPLSPPPRPAPRGSVQLREAVPFGEQFENTARIGDEARLPKRERIVGRRRIVAEDQHGQPLVIGVERGDRRFARPRERQPANVETRLLRRIAREQALDRHAAGTDETLARMSGIGESGFQQKQ